MVSEQVRNLPPGLAQFAERQPVYSSGQEAAWRYIRRVNHSWLEENAHGAYPDSVRLLLIPIDNVPRIEKVDEILGRVGFGAIGVNGFIPPLAFMGLQYHGVMPISTDMRLPENIAYTPSPDIVHESLGHLAMLSDDGYRRCLKQMGEIGVFARPSDSDFRHYNAVRRLSILKEDPSVSKAEITDAELELRSAEEESNRNPSEGKMAARLYWWTIEYGLVKGSDGRPKIYGAGLISSLSESRHCLEETARVVPLTLDGVINMKYDITQEQGTYFLADSFDHILETARQFRARLGDERGDFSLIVKPSERTHAARVDEKLDRLYWEIRCARNDREGNYNLARVWGCLRDSYPKEWLPMLELLEVLQLRNEEMRVQSEIRRMLESKAMNRKLAGLINDGLRLLAQSS